METKVNVAERFGKGSIIYIGRRGLRHKDEPNLKAEECVGEYAMLRPHVFVDYTGATVKQVMEHAAGKQGVMVDYQKIVREGSTLNEVQAWRASMWEAYPEQNEEVDGQPFVVLRFVEAGQKLNVPAQPADMLEAIRTQAPLIFNAMLKDLPRKEQLEKAETLYHQLVGMK